MGQQSSSSKQKLVEEKKVNCLESTEGICLKECSWEKLLPLFDKVNVPRAIYESNGNYYNIDSIGITLDVRKMGEKVERPERIFEVNGDLWSFLWENDGIKIGAYEASRELCRLIKNENEAPGTKMKIYHFRVMLFLNESKNFDELDKFNSFGSTYSKYFRPADEWQKFKYGFYATVSWHKSF